MIVGFMIEIRREYVVCNVWFGRRTLSLDTTRKPYVFLYYN